MIYVFYIYIPGDDTLQRRVKPQVALRAARSRPDMVRAMVLVAPAVLNPLDGKFVMGRDPNANLFSPIINLRTRVEMTAKLAAFNLQVRTFSVDFFRA